MRLVRWRVAAMGAAGLTLSACAPAFEKERLLPSANRDGPVFPLSAMEEGRGGWADLSCAIGTDGTTHDCMVVKASAPDFGAAGLSFVRQARYAPARRDGVAVEAPHHTTHITFAMPPGRIILLAHCDLQPTGTVRNCRPRQPIATETWQALRPVLEGVVAMPRTADGRAVDDPDHPVRLLLAINTPGSAPTPPTGDISGTMTLRCPNAPLPLQIATAHCTASDDDAATAGLYKADFAIRGLTAQATGDFSQ